MHVIISRTLNRKGRGLFFPAHLRDPAPAQLQYKFATLTVAAETPKTFYELRASAGARDSTFSADTENNAQSAGLMGERGRGPEGCGGVFPTCNLPCCPRHTRTLHIDRGRKHSGFPLKAIVVFSASSFPVPWPLSIFKVWGYSSVPPHAPPLQCLL